MGRRCRKPNREAAEWAAARFNRGAWSYAGQQDVKKFPYFVERYKSESPSLAISKENVKRWKADGL